jgi:hypothetical protein
MSRPKYVTLNKNTLVLEWLVNIVLNTSSVVPRVSYVITVNEDIILCLIMIFISIDENTSRGHNLLFL